MDITLTDGRVVSHDNVFFDDTNYSFKLGGTAEDITTLVRIADKKTFDGFDVTKYNEILYGQKFFREHGTWPPPVGSTSVWVNFVDQFSSGQAINIAGDYWAAKVDSALASGTVHSLVLVAVIGIGLVIMLKEA